jgi:hypothetical protein
MSDSAPSRIIDLTPAQMGWIMSPEAVRMQGKRIFDLTEAGKTSFVYEANKLVPVVDYVLGVIRKKYPDFKIPFHSRWGHFRTGGIDRIRKVDQLLANMDVLEKARCKLDLIITSVLLDAGAGSTWRYKENQSEAEYSRSEGLGLASLNLFLSEKLSFDGRSLQADSQGLSAVTPALLEESFQVSATNPLVGVNGRVELLCNLARTVDNRTLFRDGRPGNIIDLLLARHGRRLTAPQVLRAVLDGFGPIWPGRLSSRGINLGDVWFYAPLAISNPAEGLIPFHKLSQWMTYSLIEPIVEAGIEVSGVENLTGLAEYRNGGLLIDSGLLRLRDSSKAMLPLEAGSELVIEWRALTIHLLDVIGGYVQEDLGKTPAEFPLAKVLEGGTWWAGRYLAQEKRADGSPPLNIISDGTVF